MRAFLSIARSSDLQSLHQFINISECDLLTVNNFINARSLFYSLLLQHVNIKCMGATIFACCLYVHAVFPV